MEINKLEILFVAICSIILIMLFGGLILYILDGATKGKVSKFIQNLFGEFDEDKEEKKKEKK